ncbi:protein lethal(3)malignant blood neoplasm 1 [Topomyia yanbarensis]|uniref:protein lethal(3)malignant blood neoplasm 1 n=1 Tax=Topomyia yanbarensis TaxID=2498891 RepID=UPI00273B18EE|nr:protein lethal(3)malignant blood neoplasm 1 [Topomyia yanbarensis]
MSIKIFIVVLLLSLVKAASKYYDGPVRPYEFGYSIEGNQHRKESKDENGIVMGEFGFITADNVYHVTVYATDENGNFKIISMKNYKLGPTVPPQPQGFARTAITTSTTTTTSTTPQPFRIITTARTLTTPKPSDIAACGGCKIPEPPTTTSKTITEATLPETSTQFVPPFKIVNKNDIESITTTNSPKSLPTTTSAVSAPKSDPEETPQKLVEKQSNDRNYSSKESTNPPKAPNDMQTISNTPTTQSRSQPQSSSPNAISNSDGAKQSQSKSSQSSKSAPTTPPASPKSFSTMEKLDRYNTANMMIQHILNGLLYRFNYTVGFHGHHEQGDRQGNKEGGYYAIGRDGIRRGVTYTANEFGFQPHIKFEKVSPEETPREETEKKAGLKGFDFQWFWGKS